VTKHRRGIYLLPNLFTTGALFAGFYSIVAAMNEQFEPAAIAIFVAMVLDGMDGRIARLTNTASEFGMQYDSLSDMVSFGLAPALIMYQWALSDIGKLGWLAAFVYTASAALRLARFNTQAASIDKRFFQGLPSPAAAAVLAGMIWFGSSYGLTDGTTVLVFCLPVTVLVGILMVSNIRYHSFKQLDLKGRVPFMAVLVVIPVFVFIAVEPPLVLCVVTSLYAISGPILTLILIRKHRESRKASDEDAGNT
jgi:CDP-diacylglycerol---serine O-phosphatidyltransferase